MTRGGNRNPLGRPKSKGETRTVNLCGVRLRPTQLETYRAAARAASLSLSRWVERCLDAKVTETTRHLGHNDYAFDVHAARLRQQIAEAGDRRDGELVDQLSAKLEAHEARRREMAKKVARETAKDDHSGD